jgi:NAD(P)H-dependent flavin oxidoreductase YrpB (nitropropane dioxygenase family)
MIQTKFQEIIGTKYPIIQAGMGPYSTNNLCIEAAKAGALGIISTVGMAAGVATPETEKFFGKGRPQEILQRVILNVYEELKDYPNAIFGINVPVSNDFVIPAKRFITGLIDLFGQKPEIKGKLKVIITSAGDPLPWAINARDKGSRRPRIPIKEKLPDITWCHVCPSVRGAKRAEKADVDIIIASGREGGAHCAWRDASTIVLIPECVEQVNKPIIAAGGFCDGKSLAAALTLGAIGIQMGTRFIATKESDFTEKWKDQIIELSETDTLVARGLFGPMRFLRNSLSLNIVDQTILGASDLYRGIPCESTNKIMELEMEGLRHLMNDEKTFDESLILGGIVTGRIHSLPTVKEVVESIMSEAENIISNIAKNVLK